MPKCLPFNRSCKKVFPNILKYKNKSSKINFPKGSLFAKGEKPKFLGGTKSAVKLPRTNTNQPKKKGFFAGLFGKKEEKNFIKKDNLTI